MGEKNNYRYERKFVLQDMNESEFLNILKKRAYGFSTHYPERWVNSIYYDSANLKLGAENIDGIGNRIKLRLRWYGNKDGIAVSPKLEFKIKRGLVGDKRILAVNDFDSRKNLHTLTREICAQDIPSDVRLALRQFVPMVLVRYRRSYYISRDKKFRLTFDDSIQYFNAGHGYLRGVGHKDENRIVEIKYAVTHDTEVDKICDSFPFRLNKNSKYINALNSIYALRF